MMETEQMQDAAAMEQMAFAPQGFTEQEGDLNLDEFEIVSPQFFAQIKEPAFTVNVNRITVNSACVRMMMDVDFVEILISRKEKKLVLRPCSEMDISGYKWARTKDGKRYASQRTGEPFVLSLCQIMGWNPDYRYKILGKMDRSRLAGSFVSKEQPSIIDDPTIKSGFYGAPTVCVVFAQGNFLYSIPDAFCCAENMVLAATELGISSCIIARWTACD